MNGARFQPPNQPPARVRRIGLGLLLLFVTVGASGQLLHPSDLVYEGLIAPPKISGSGPRFGYGLVGLEYDPTCAGREDLSPADGYPGCLVGTSHKDDDMMAMFDIPKPYPAEVGDYDSVPKGFLVVDFFKCSIRHNGSDIQQELDAEEFWVARDIPGVARSEKGDWLCTCGHDWYDVNDFDYRSHCWFDFDPIEVNSSGAFGFGKPGDKAFHSQRMSWYLGSIPQAWADKHLKARKQPFCFSGMQRMGGGCPGCSGGPTIYAFQCTEFSYDGPQPWRQAQQLLGYPGVNPIQVATKLHPDFSPRSQARGATWAGAAVLISALKGGDYWWYGKDDPWTDPHAHRSSCLFHHGSPDSCFMQKGPYLPWGTKDHCRPGSKGYHALLDPDGSGGPQYTAQLQFYDARELGEVAAGEREPESVLPYAWHEGPPELWDSDCAEPRDLAFDPENRKLYWVETNKEQPLIHVYTVNEPQCCNELLELEVSVTGGGEVTSEPDGIDCGGDCREVFLEGTGVVLSARPLAEGSFTGWGGGLDCEDGEVTMYRDTSCTAHFECPLGSEIMVTDQIIDGPQTFEHCDRIVVGPAVVLESGAQVTLQTGRTVEFRSPFAVEAGASLRVVASPSS